MSKRTLIILVIALVACIATYFSFKYDRDQEPEPEPEPVKDQEPDQSYDDVEAKRLEGLKRWRAKKSEEKNAASGEPLNDPANGDNKE